jgi:hypothetical protein
MSTERQWSDTDSTRFNTKNSAFGLYTAFHAIRIVRLVSTWATHLPVAQMAATAGRWALWNSSGETGRHPEGLIGGIHYRSLECLTPEPLQ